MNLQDFLRSIPRERPTGVTILAVLCFLSGAYTVIGALAGAPILFRGGGGGMLVYPVHAIIFLLTIAFFFAKGALLAFIGMGLLKLQNWGRVLLIVLTGLGLLMAIRALAHSVSAFIGIAIFLMSLLYLFTPNVKQAFGATRF